MKKTICYYHFMGKESNVTIKGIGDCSICKSNGNNKYCKNYIKIHIVVIEAEEIINKRRDGDAKS